MKAVRTNRVLVVAGFSAALGLLGPQQSLAESYAFRTIDVPGAGATTVNGINNHGDVVGTFVQDGIGYGFLFDGETFTTLTFPGAKSTMAKGINDAGQIVGSYSSSPFLLGQHGFLFDHGEYTILDLPDAGRRIIEAEDINNHGQITGILADAEAVHAFLLEGEDYSRITVPDTHRTEGLGLNDAGVVAGRTLEGEPPTIRGQISGHWSGFTHNVDGFDLIRAGWVSVSVTDVNNAGQLVGWWEPNNGLDDYARGFFWDGSEYSTIRYPSADDTMPLGLNDNGQIVGYYWGREYGMHGFIATPVPEPSTCILLLSGISCVVCLVLRSRRKNKQSADQVCLKRSHYEE